jgi:hypothetical protein
MALIKPVSDPLQLVSALPPDLQREVLSYLHCSTDGCSPHLACGALAPEYPHRCSECAHGLHEDGIDGEELPSSGCPVTYSRCGLVRRCCSTRLTMTLFTPMRVHAREHVDGVVTQVVLRFCNAMCLLRYLKHMSSPSLELRDLRFYSVSQTLRPNIICLSGGGRNGPAVRVQILRDFIGRHMQKVRVDLNALFYTADPCAYYKVIMLDLHWSIYRYYHSCLRALETKFEEVLKIVNQGIQDHSAFYRLVPAGIKSAPSFSDLLVHLTNLKYFARTTKLWQVVL